MIRCVVISPDSELRQALIHGLQAMPGVALLRTLDHYPQTFEAGRLFESLRPAVVLIEANRSQELAGMVRQIEQLSPEVRLIGVNWNTTSSALLEAMHAGVRDFVSAPFTQDRLADVLNRVGGLEVGGEMVPDPGHRVYAFIPAKAGVGASTLATNTAIALAARHGGNSLLMDFDFLNGVIGCSLRLRRREAGLADDEGETGMAESIWRARIRRHGQLDVLPTPVDHALDCSVASDARQLLRLARRKYKATVVDLPGQFDDEAYGLLRQSHLVLLVVTPELASLRLAHERIAQLRAENLDDRVELVINRSGTIRRGQVEDLLGCPVYFEFPNNYHAVNAAFQSGTPVGALAGRFDRFAAILSGEPAALDDELTPRPWTGLLGGNSRSWNKRLA